MQPPAVGNNQTVSTKVNGRTYSATPGTVLLVPDFDADMLEANGWFKSAVGGAGTTTQRPAIPKTGQEFHDISLGFNIRWDGKAWRNPTSGAIV